MHPRPLLIASLLALTSAAAAQQIEVLGNPVQPGVPFTVILTNNTQQFLPISAAPSLHLLQPTGELIAPTIVGCGPVGILMPPGATQNLSFTTPVSGPGSAGSFELLYPYGNGAVARLDVGAASPAFPDIHTYPANTPANAAGHFVAFPPAQTPDWELANTGSGSHTFGAGDRINLFTPGGATSAASLSLAGITVPAGGVTRVLLPLTGLVPGPYTVQVRWTDQARNSTTTVRHGIEAAPTTGVDLHLPGGKVVPWGGALPARLAARGFAMSVGFPPQSEPLTYALLLGFVPGSTALPGGAVLPLTLDGIVVSSVLDGFAGSLTNHLGMMTDAAAYCAHSQLVVPSANGISIRHLNLPVLSGLTFRVAGLVINGSGAVAASQPEEIVFQ